MELQIPTFFHVEASLCLPASRQSQCFSGLATKMLFVVNSVGFRSHKCVPGSAQLATSLESASLRSDLKTIS